MAGIGFPVAERWDASIWDIVANSDVRERVLWRYFSWF